jgi:integrase
MRQLRLAWPRPIFHLLVPVPFELGRHNNTDQGNIEMPVVQFTAEFMASGLICPPDKKRIEYCVNDEPGLFVECRSSTKAVPTWTLRLKNAQGTNLYKQLGTVKELTLTQAKKLARQRRAEHQMMPKQETTPIPEKVEINLAEFMRDHYMPHAKMHKRSHAKDDQLYRMRIGPKFGHLALSAITRREVQVFHNALLSEGLSAATANHHVVLFKRALNLAVQWEMLDRNVLKGIPLFTLDNQVENYLNDEQIQSLVKVLRADPNRTVCDILMFLLSTGARRMSAMQAKWSEIDLENCLWKIPAINSKSKRTAIVPLNDSAIHVLAQLESKGKSEYLFPNAETGKPYTTIMRVWYRLRKKAGLNNKVRVHDLRHTFASRLVSAGRSLYEVQRCLSHADPRTTMRYSHLSTKALLEAANAASVLVPQEQPKAA